MNYDYRSLVESLDEIMYEEEHDVHHEDEIVDHEEVEIEGSEELSPQQLMKDVLDSLKCVIDCVSAEEIQDQGELVEKLKSVKETLDSLHGDAYNTPHQDEMVEEEKLPLNNIDGNEYGTENMGPRIDSAGKQHYEKKSGSSYAARNGFVGP